MSFTDKTAVVTGAAGGMGLNIAQDLLAAGAQVAMLDIKDRPVEIAATGRAHYFQGDVSDDRFVADATRQIFAKTGRVDYLVNAAGVLWFGRDKSLVDMDLDVWQKVIDINLKSMVVSVRHAVPLMKRAGGAMVHISTIQCLRGDDRPQDAYQAAKAGMIALSKSIAIQFARDSIRSNIICPGPTQSPMQERWQADPTQLKATAEAVPLGRVGTTQDMANACLFLLSDKASFITGTELIVDGGLLARP
ncbi:MAG: SDR family NAD(P)-dependent oxidoreductase [Dongiaceae bacterium]